jgi:hypothetical protein
MKRDIIEQYKYLHQQGRFPGFSLREHIPEITRLVKEHDAKTLLDYGCGKASCWLKEGAIEKVGVRPTLYDPAVSGLSKKPTGQFDGVICTDVLEHCEEPEKVIAELVGYATKFLFVDVSCQRSGHKKLPDGRPLHITVHPPAWWRERIKADIPVILHFDVPG